MRKLLVTLIVAAQCWHGVAQKMIAYYPFNGNANDESGLGSHAVVNGASLTVDRHGNTHSAYLFDGVDDYIETPLGCNLVDYSYSIWFKTESADDFRCIGRVWDGNSYTGTCLFANGTLKSYERRNTSGNGVEFQTTTTYNDGFWHQLVITSEVGADFSTYIDGRKLDARTTRNDFLKLTNLTFQIGVDNEHGTRDDFFRGSLDDFRFFNYELSGKEVARLYKAEKPSMLLAYYPFNGNANDESVYGNDGTVYGAELTTDRHGNPNSAYAFDGINDYIQIPSSAQNQLGSNDFTISTWFRSTSSLEGVIWNKRNTSSCSQASGPSIGFSQTSVANGNTFFGIARGNNEYLLNTTGSVFDNQWHYGVMVRRGDTLFFYLDGSPEDSVMLSPAEDFSTTLDLFIGKTTYCSGNHFTGDIDEFKIYRKAFSSRQIQHFYDKEVNHLPTHQVLVFPNPTNDFLFVKWSRHSYATISDLAGNVLFRSYKRKIDLRELDPGVYLVTLRSKTGDEKLVRVVKE